MIEAFSSTTQKQDYLAIDEQVKQQLQNVYGKIMTKDQQSSRIFNFLDAELGTRRTPFEAINYKKLIVCLEKSQILGRFCIDVLIKKADRFIDKQSIQKEKEKYKNLVRDQLIANQNINQPYVSSQDEEEQEETKLVNQNNSTTKTRGKKTVVIHDDQWMDDDDQFEDELEYKGRLPSKSIAQSQYLKVFKERV